MSGSPSELEKQALPSASAGGSDAVRRKAHSYCKCVTTSHGFWSFHSGLYGIFGGLMVVVLKPEPDNPAGIGLLEVPHKLISAHCSSLRRHHGIPGCQLTSVDPLGRCCSDRWHSAHCLDRFLMAQYLDASFSNEYRSSLSKTVVTLCHGLSVKLAGRGGSTWMTVGSTWCRCLDLLSHSSNWLV